MFKSAKRKVGRGKEKFDFKLEFHASRVPQRGWDKLVVLLIPLETGKVTVKTGKAGVQNGTCQWTIPVYESAKIPSDGKTKDVDKAMYKLVVSTGSSRSRVLGETAINFAEHIGADAPTALALPLQNCDAGTILHVKVLCLAPKSDNRDLEDQTERMEDAERAEFNSDFSGNKKNGVSQHSVSENQLIIQASTKENPAAPHPPQCSLESLDIPLISGENSQANNSGIYVPGGDPVSPSTSFSSFTGRQESVGGLTDFSGFSKTGSQDSSNIIRSPSIPAKPTKSGISSNCLHAHSLKLSHDLHLRQTEQIIPAVVLKWNSKANLSYDSISLDAENSVPKCMSSHRRSNSLTTGLKATETPIEDVQTEAVPVKWNTWKMGAEIEKLEQQLDVETKPAMGRENDLFALTAERDSLKLEIEQLKSTRQTFEKSEANWDKVLLELEDAKNTIKELHDELGYEKSVNLSLNLQLQKTQDSNSELLLEIQDLEGFLLEKNEEIEGLKIKLETHPRENKKQKEISDNPNVTWLQKLQAGGNKIYRIGEQIASLHVSTGKEATLPDGELGKMIQKLMKELDALESGIQDLTTEDYMDLVLELKQSYGNVTAKNELIAHLASEFNKLSEQPLHITSDIEVEADQTRELAVNDLNEKLKFTEDFSQHQLASGGTPLHAMNSSAIVLQSRIADLELQLKCSEEDVSSLTKKLDALKGEIDNNEKERSLFASQKGQLKSLRERVASTEQGYRSALKRAEDLETENLTLRTGMDWVVATLEEQLKKTEEKACIENEMYTNAVQMISNLQAEKAQLGERISKLLAAKEASEVKVGDLERMNAELHDRLHQVEFNCTEAFHQVHEHETKVASCLEEIIISEAQVRDLKDKLLQLEENREQLEIKVQEKEKENTIHTHSITELKSQLSTCKEEMCSLSKSRSAFEMKTQELELQNNDLRSKLQLAQDAYRIARESTEVLVRDIKSLKAKIGFNLETSLLIENEKMSPEIWKDFLLDRGQNLTDTNMKVRKMINVAEVQYRNLAELEEAGSVPIPDFQTDYEVLLQTEVKKQQCKMLNLQNKLVKAGDRAACHIKTIQNFHMYIGNMETNISSQDPLKPDLVEHLEKILEEHSAYSLKMELLRDELARLERESKGKERMSDESQSLITSQEEFNLRVGKTLDTLRTLGETTTAVECLSDDKQLKEKISCVFYPDNMATKALPEISQLQTEMGDLEEKLRHMQDMIGQVNTDFSCLIDNLDLKDEVTKDQQLKMETRLEKALKELDTVRKDKTCCLDRMAELESKCAILEEENFKSGEEISRLQNEFQVLQSQLQGCRNDLHEAKVEKIEAETSLQTISLERSKFVAELTVLKEKAATSEEAVGRLKQSKAGSEQKSDLVRLRRRAGELKRKLLEQEEEKEELKKKVYFLEEEVKRKAGALATAEKKLKEKVRDETIKASYGAPPMSVTARSLPKTHGNVGPTSNSSLSRELADLRERVKLLEGEVKNKAAELEISKKKYKEKEMELCGKIEHLESVNGQLVEAQKDLSEKLQDEEERLDNHRSTLIEPATNASILERVVTVETELVQALEAYNMSEGELSTGTSHQNMHLDATVLGNIGSTDQIIQDLAGLKRKNLCLEEEIRDMHERYSLMSLQFAEVEAQREELVMTIKALRCGEKLDHSNSFS